MTSLFPRIPLALAQGDQADMAEALNVLSLLFMVLLLREFRLIITSE